MFFYRHRWRRTISLPYTGGFLGRTTNSSSRKYEEPTVKKLMD
jgi:hypothetical protein